MKGVTVFNVVVKFVVEAVKKAPFWTGVTVGAFGDRGVVIMGPKLKKLIVYKFTGKRR